MYSTLNYLIRSQLDGSYLTSRISSENKNNYDSYLLVFREHFDALSYLNSHAQDLSKKFAIESLSPEQIQQLMQRWGFTGIGLVEDPLIPRIQFLTIDNSNPI